MPIFVSEKTGSERLVSDLFQAIFFIGVTFPLVFLAQKSRLCLTLHSLFSSPTLLISPLSCLVRNTGLWDK